MLSWRNNGYIPVLGSCRPLLVLFNASGPMPAAPGPAYIAELKGQSGVLFTVVPGLVHQDLQFRAIRFRCETGNESCTAECLLRPATHTLIRFYESTTTAKEVIMWCMQVKLSWLFRLVIAFDVLLKSIRFCILIRPTTSWLARSPRTHSG